LSAAAAARFTPKLAGQPVTLLQRGQSLCLPGQPGIALGQFAQLGRVGLELPGHVVELPGELPDLIARRVVNAASEVAACQRAAGLSQAAQPAGKAQRGHETENEPQRDHAWQQHGRCHCQGLHEIARRPGGSIDPGLAVVQDPQLLFIHVGDWRCRREHARLLHPATGRESICQHLYHQRFRLGQPWLAEAAAGRVTLRPVAGDHAPVGVDHNARRAKPSACFLFQIGALTCDDLDDQAYRLVEYLSQPLLRTGLKWIGGQFGQLAGVAECRFPHPDVTDPRAEQTHDQDNNGLQGQHGDQRHANVGKRQFPAQTRETIQK
jgi:hypothetical protein